VCLLVGLLPMAVRLALLPVRPIPEPAVQDESSYLLGADTFRQGRITNPPHALWVHFETFHENFQPTYASKYPPAQSLILAAGWKLFGHPWYGVLLSCGLMCAALSWMLQGWLPPSYALLGGLMAGAQWGIAGYWINSYWGGAVAAAAGALVVGAVPRLARHPMPGTTALAALGLVVLANSRPCEGAVTAIGAVGALYLWRRRSNHPMRELFAWPIALPAGMILVCGLAAMLYYNYSVTGHPLEMPYVLNQAQNGGSPIFWMMPLHPPPVYRHDVIRRFWLEWDLPYYRLAHSFPPVVLLFFVNMLRFFLTPISAIALFTAIVLRGGRKVRIALAMAGTASAGLLLERFPNPHYFAPATGLVLLLAMLGVQYVRVKFGRRALAAFAALFFVVAAIQASRLAEEEYPHGLFTAHRQSVIHRLQHNGGRHLAIVRYAADHNVLEEWVYNRADIDGSAIVWARDMGDAANRELLDYYAARQPDRHVWMVQADAAAPKPVPYAPR
jgi:hypothetical protein